MSESLNIRTGKAIFWSFIDRFGIQICNLVIQVILARLILPAYFGVVVTSMIVLNILSVFVDAGFGAALIQRKNISRTDISTVFYLNVGIALTVVIFLMGTRQAIADYFEESELVWVVPALSLSLLAASFGQAQSQMLSKTLNFKLLTQLSFPSVLLGGAVGIVMALLGANIWALICQQVTTNGSRSLLLWRKCPQEIQPDFGFSFESLKRLFGFSFGVFGGSLLHRVAQNLAGLIIAKSFGAEDLAFYDRARLFQKSSTQPLVGLINRVLFPVFSEIQDDKAKIRSALRYGVPLAIGFTAPMMFWMMATAENLVIVILTDAWSDSIQYLRVVPLMGITLVLSGVKANVIRSQGDGRLAFLLSLYRNTVILLGLLLTWQYGIMAMVVGQVVCFGLNMIVNDYFTYRYTGYTMMEQWRDWLPSVLLAGFAAMLSLAVYLVAVDSHLANLLIQTIVFLTAYLFGCKLFGLEFYQRLIQLGKHIQNPGRFFQSAP